MTSHDFIKATYEAAGQGHVLQFYDELDSTQQETLLSQLSAIHPQRVNQIYNAAVRAEQTHDDHPDNDSAITPPPSDVRDDSPSEGARAEWSRIGLDAVASNKIAVILLAGGQGTRLGSSDPKGCYNIGLPSNKSLFQLQAERIRKLQSLAAAGGQENVVVPWYIMTSGPTRKATEAYFEENKYFGLDKANVIFFDQGVLPCLTNEGKIFLETKASVATAPDGNGGIYAALRSRTATKRSFSVLQDMRKRKVEYIYCYCVDNCLAKVGDPVFLGYCIQKEAKCGTKVVKKTNPKESVGVVALKGGKWSVVEYSEISSEHAEARNEVTGELLFKAANIANHFYTLAYLDSTEALEQNMAYHIARKKIPHVDLSTGEAVKPSKPNGMKLEQFIFDVLPFLTPLNTHALFQVDRNSEFSPLKNAPNTGSDDPQTSRRDLLNLQKKWLEEAGATVLGEVELSPLVSYAGEGLEKFKGKTIREGRAESVEELEALCE